MERQGVKEAILFAVAPRLAEQRGLHGEVVVGDPRALGLAGGAARVEQERGRVGADRGEIGGDDQRVGARVVAEPRELARGVERRERERDAAAEEHAEGGLDPRGAGRGEDGDALAFERGAATAERGAGAEGAVVGLGERAADEVVFDGEAVTRRERVEAGEEGGTHRRRATFARRPDRSQGASIGRERDLGATFRLCCAAMPDPLAIRARSLAVPLLALGALLAACDDPPKPAAGASASATASVVVAAPTPPKPKTMPELLVDSAGPYLGGTRINLADPQGPEKMAKVVKELPIDGQTVTLIVEKKAKTSHVAAVVAALGEAGAPKVTIKTDGRDDLPKEITVTPEVRVASTPACTLATMVLKDLSTAIWSVRGGTAKKQRKGMAGPDLSNTGEQITKDLAACDSTTAVFSGDEAVAWENAFNLAGTTLRADEKKKLDTLVLPREAPVAGRAVVLGKR